MKLNRRTLCLSIGTLGIGSLSGCTALSRQDNSNVEYTEASIESEGLLEYDIEIVQNEFRNTDDPVTISLTISHSEDVPVYFMDSRAARLVNQPSVEFQRHDLMTVDPDDTRREENSHQPNIEFDGCWRLLEPIPMTTDVKVGVIEPDETITQELYVLVNNQSGGDYTCDSPHQSFSIVSQYRAQREDEMDGAQFPNTEQKDVTLYMERE